MKASQLMPVGLLAWNLSRTVAQEPRIVGGKESVVGEYNTYAFSAGSLLCGATVIHFDILLTAAHCVGAFLGGVFIGGNQLDGEDAKYFADVSMEYPHPAFNTTEFEFENDAMLVKLIPPPNATLTFQTLNFDATKPSDGDILKVIGFGHTSYKGNVSQKLQEVDLYSVNSNTCSDQYVNVGLKMNSMSTICTTFSDKPKGSCQGDSGGPLFDTEGDQVGIVSWGIECGNAMYPDVYTRISSFETFIRKGVCELSDFPPSDCQTEPSSAPSPSSLVGSSPAPSSLVGKSSVPSSSPTITAKPNLSSEPTAPPTENNATNVTPAPTRLSNVPTAMPSVTGMQSHSSLPSRIPSANSPINVTSAPVGPSNSPSSVPTLTMMPSQSNVSSLVPFHASSPTTNTTSAPSQTPTTRPTIRAPNATSAPSTSPIVVNAPTSIPAKVPTNATPVQVPAPTSTPVQVPAPTSTGFSSFFGAFLNPSQLPPPTTGTGRSWTTPRFIKPSSGDCPATDNCNFFNRFQGVYYHTTVLGRCRHVCDVDNKLNELGWDCGRCPMQP